MNPIKQKTLDVGWDGGRGDPRTAPRTADSAEPPELRNQNRNRIQRRNQSFTITSMNYRKVGMKFDKN